MGDERYSDEDLRRIRKYATKRQAEVIDAVLECETRAEAAARCNFNSPVALYRCIRRAARKAADAEGFEPSLYAGQQGNSEIPVPDGYRLKGTSTLVRTEDGIQWVKTERDAERQRELLEEAAQAFAERLPKVEPTPAPEGLPEDKLDLYVVTDYHLGLYAWHEETGADWDIDIAEDLLIRWFEAAIAAAPPAKVGLFCQLGDFLHWDGLEAVTPTSRHILEADTRYPLLVRTAIRAVRRIIAMLLDKHEQVHVLMAEGNHDLAGSVWLRELLAAVYEDEPRITVDQNADPYYCYEFGDTSLFFHHGHKRLPKNLDEVFVGKFRDVFGRTKHSYGHTGHMHHVKSIESNLMIVEQHRTLAAPSAHDSASGFTSGRWAKVCTYDRKHGFVGELAFSPDMVA